MKQGAWKIPEIISAGTSALEDAGLPRLLSAVLASRGYGTPEKAALYLCRDEALLSDPYSLRGMKEAVSRLCRAIETGERVAVYGDYDVDGITSSCLLCDYLKSRGLDCRIYIPDRIDEGYGLNSDALESLKDMGVSLVVTVDCGITAVSDAEYAKGIGLDIIITDHHECPQTLPECCAVVNPKREEPGHPAANLAGVGVAMKLAAALEGDGAGILARYCDLAAVGTIADVMPLVGENRVIASAGLNKLKNNPRPGFAALLEESGAMDKPLTATVVGYTLAPRINAAGRLCETSKSVELLMCRDAGKAREYALALCALNRRRQELEQAVWNESVARLGEEEPVSPIVLASKEWHPGVVGIAASRLADAYCLPAVMICLDGENGKGSCRSYGDFNLFDALTACGGYLESFGGHAFAAGINIKEENIEAFSAALAEYYAENTPGEPGGLSPELQLPDFSLLTMENVESLEELEPCGSGNPKPLFCVCGVSMDTVTELGGGKHLRLGLSSKGRLIEGVFFSKTLSALGLRQSEIADVCFVPQINEFRARKSVQLLIAGIRQSYKPALCREILEGSGALPDSAGDIGLSREELGAIWRVFRGAGGFFRLRELFTDPRFGHAEPVKVCLSMRVFAELGLMAYRLETGGVSYEVREGGPKASLEDSPLFLMLSKTKRAE